MTPYEKIFENNRRWAEEQLRSDPEYFAKLSVEQRPDFLYIGCSDSRVPANQIMGLAPGDVFVHRNVANLVNNVDLNVMSVISYAVQTLDVKHIIVCGHYGCGGVQAAMQPKDLGILNPWLRNIRDVYRLHKAELDAIPDGERYDRLVELNVTEQCINIIKTAAVQKSFLNRGFPTVHAWVFDMRNGLIKDLKLDFRETLRNIQQVYDLTGSRWD
ncbi:carbonic anhydrase [Pyxidicoccus fallax]|uniref:Carbonic anhydrase 2 n=1 Tax=Pyxidicoccus fallax TaxID=394095 RepID=A0A848LWD1_9BACT|nr:carbonic anhydrase [Pyxidicoccus fallax]NPC83933.1 carbonic anhydrase [Pyxidicoccus fallax]